ncbi:MAG: helix-turn-helix domain-containing protein [Schaedlerella sp.]|uniref:helix-turn-helix domain-containing protein n=1 Tax=Schaedlerella sp. TaxID=2676057 RepID=UPI00265F3EBD|nr:helix-turn-helix transcriptional regulator [uncultured Schaedlerella sp.]
MIEDQIIERIQELCTRKHISLYRLAKNAELPYSSLNNILHRRTCPTVTTLERLCKGLNVSLSEFFDFEIYPIRNEELTADEEELLNKYKNLSARKRELLHAYMDGLSQK